MKTRVLKLWMGVLVVMLFLSGCIQLTNNSITPHLVQKTGLKTMESVSTEIELDSLYEIFKNYQAIELEIASNQLAISGLLQKIEKEGLINTAIFAMILSNLEPPKAEFNALPHNRNLTINAALDTMNRILKNDIYNFNETYFTMVEIKNN
jgi:hypothetical protein